MSRIFIFMLMVFCHIVDDFYLQGWLASAKQKVWWKNNAPQDLYRYDYIAALCMHSMSWAFMIMLPLAVSMEFLVGKGFAIAFVINAMIHGIVDDLKANKGKLNLITDQCIHMLQITVTAFLMM